MAFDKKFRNPVNNSFLTQALFLEITSDVQNVNNQIMYTLKDHPHKGYPSLKQLYLEMEDITEYEFAQKYLDGWPHWERLLNTNSIRPHIDQWRKELELKVKAKALRRLMDEAANNGKEAVSINKFLVQRGYVDKDTKGRPSKQAIKEEAQRLAHLESSLQEDLERISTNNKVN